MAEFPFFFADNACSLFANEPINVSFELFKQNQLLEYNNIPSWFHLQCQMTVGITTKSTHRSFKSQPAAKMEAGF
jgi:hypothetical protein